MKLLVGHKEVDSAGYSDLKTALESTGGRRVVEMINESSGERIKVEGSRNGDFMVYRKYMNQRFYNVAMDVCSKDEVLNLFEAFMTGRTSVLDQLEWEEDSDIGRPYLMYIGYALFIALLLCVLVRMNF